MNNTFVFSFFFQIVFSLSPCPAGIRSRERSYLAKAGILQSFSLSIVSIIPSLASVLSIIIHVAMGNSLSASQVINFRLFFVEKFWGMG